MTAVLNTIILAFIGVSILAALFFIVRALRSRSMSSREAYGVGQVEAARSMKIDIARGIAFILLGLILWGVYGLSSGPAAATADPTALPPTTAPAASTDEPDTAVPPPTTTKAIPTPVSATIAPAPTPTAQPTLEPTEEAPTAAPITAVVISEVGVWLRGTPSTAGEQLEWVLNGTALTVLPGQQTADEFDWQQVRTPDGNEGWVAVDFIEINEQ